MMFERNWLRAELKPRFTIRGRCIFNLRTPRSGFRAARCLTPNARAIACSDCQSTQVSIRGKFSTWPTRSAKSREQNNLQCYDQGKEGRHFRLPVGVTKLCSKPLSLDKDFRKREAFSYGVLYRLWRGCNRKELLHELREAGG